MTDELPTFHIVDGGYITHVFGMTGWGQANWPPLFLRDSIVMMDSKEKTIREEQYPKYKGERRKRRKDNPYLHETWKRVRSFREIIHDDPRLTLSQVPGLEADDLVVLAAWKFKSCNVLGIDKDLLQASRYMRMYNYHGERITRASFQHRLAKTLQSNPLYSRHIPMVLSILGDKSDSVPRLLAPRDLGTLWRMLWDSGTPDWDAAYNKWGKLLLRNLSLVLLPHPSVFNLKRKEMFDIVRAGEWRPKLLSQLVPYIREEVDKWTLSKS